MLEAPARFIVERLRGAGFQAYYAGGAVRDRLLGIPARDFDVTTDATPEQVRRLFPRHSAVGARFGVVLVHGEPDAPGAPATNEPSVEVATFRTDGSYRDGRHPDAVSYARDAREDVRRRDFTINGLLLDPESGETLDYVGGRADLEARLVRAIGDPERRFQEDRLRMLRAVRFAARLDFALEPATLAAIRRQAGEIHVVSPERIRDELLRMLTEGRPRSAFELLDTTGLLAAVLPEVAAMKGVPQPPQFHPEGDVWVHTLRMLELLPYPCAPELALAVLLHDVGKPPTFRRAPDRIRFDRHAEIGARIAAAIGERLRLPGAEAAAVEALVADHMRFGDVPRMRESTLKRFLRRPGFEHLLELHRLDCLGSHGDLTLYQRVVAEQMRLPAEALRPPRLLTGDDLIRLGYPPGPVFHEILEAVEDAQLEGRLADGAAAVAFVRDRWTPGV